MKARSTRRAPRIACLWIPHLPAQAESLRHHLSSQPIIIYDADRVFDSCDATFREGVRPGDFVHQALARCPDARLIAAERGYYQKVVERVLEAVELHCPLFEPHRLGVVYLEAQGMGDLYGSEEAWCEAVCRQVLEHTELVSRVGVAGTKFAAWMAALLCAPEDGQQIVPTKDSAYLAPLALDYMSLPRETYRRLRLLGMRTMGQFAQLPATTIAEQFGPEVVEAYQWARGQDPRPIIGQRQRLIEVHTDFELPENRRPALLAAMLDIARQPVNQLIQNGLSVRRIIVRAQLAGGDVWERSSWMGGFLGPDRLEIVLEHMVDSLEGDGPGIVDLDIRLVGLEPIAGKQLNLFAHAENRLRLEETLQKLSQKHSGDCVLRPITRTPAAPIIAERYKLEGVPA